MQKIYKIFVYIFSEPNPPGRFIAWLRNETTLIVLWQPPYPSGIFDKYRVTISPEDALQSELFVYEEMNPSGVAQAAFYGLIPGRNYNISVQTVSKYQISEPTKIQHRTGEFRENFYKRNCC